MRTGLKRRIEEAAVKAGWDDPCPREDRSTGGYYWNGAHFAKDSPWCESLSTKTLARCYLLAARLLKVKVTK